MKWFYSGAKTLDVEQRTPEKSLGGYRSSTVVPNGRINSMFNDFSSLTLQEAKSETKAFFVKNTFDKKVTGILLYATYPENPDITFEIAAVDGDVMEQLKSGADEPYYEDFFDCRVVFAYSDMIIKDTFNIGEIATIEGISIPVQDGKRETFMNNAVRAFESNPQYKAIILAEDKLRIEYKLLGIYINTPIVQSFNSGTITAPDFANGFDNSRLISNSLESGESVGIFLKRKIIQKPKKTFADIEAAYNLFKDSNYSQTQNLLTETINFCLEFTKQ